ncbi:uncharacterized protein TRUGW13939_04534 [Talaromyces rugulosus]|uniref:NACHT domain-containing protein n=1 Tax=Talaromyces rugulosus TaxID=121627 RepID=A0A7H8QTV8_TALRU|nr:uncharacterized protein TRUGW13939_04534 [Talaromyces rugulosus]QKX57422.1 hypothetical protein TRUGW13939_04534 [Talaromyces rugulosus]
MLGQTTQTVAAPSVFNLALDDYIRSRPRNSKTPQFIQKLQQQQDAGERIDAQSVLQDIGRLHRDATDRRSASAARKILMPVVTILSTYSGVVDTLAQADPMPTAVIWGCLKAVIDSSQRFLDLYDKISDQIDRLNIHLDVLTEYDWLFTDSSTMRELLRISYIDIIRFWVRVEKECKRCVANRLARAVAPFSTSKIDKIIAKIGETADGMARVIPVVQERLNRKEQENTLRERELAGIAREEQTAFIQRYEERYAEELKELAQERKRQRQRDVQNWIRAGPSPLNESNHRHHDEKRDERSPGTCEWLFKDQMVQSWAQSYNTASQIWVKASPGVGKSVLTAYAVETIPKICNESCAVIYQYFTFDEEFRTIVVYRSLAEQLANQLGTITEMPEDVHEFTQRGASSTKADDVKTVISKLVEKIPVTYVFLDGLDEECKQEPRRKMLFDILSFFDDLASKTSSRLRLWYSSQQHTCLDDRFQNHPSIEVTKSLNGLDIETYLSHKFTALDRLDLHEGYKNLILQELSEKADGCFLWVSLMLHSMSKAVMLSQVQNLIEDGLPGDYEKYYQRKVEGIEPSLKEFVSILLACIVHARRPLRLDELCECIAMARGHSGCDIDEREKLYEDMVLELCQPLVRVHEVQGQEETFEICTLTHGSVKTFLLKNPQILTHGPGSPAYALTTDVMANICLKYLLQPRYQYLLTKKGETFVDLNDKDIMDHHLLSYAAKYWDKHLDSVEFSPQIYEKVLELITSPKFFTLLQIQSLLVEGQFQFWFQSSRPFAGEHIRRVFPHWFEENCIEDFQRDYKMFVGEWGALLDEDTSLEGTYQGEIDRCFFEALGSHNFLHRGPSRYKSLSFSTEDTKKVELPNRSFEGVDETGNLLVVLKLESLVSEQLKFCCERWCLAGHRPKFQGSQTLYSSPSSWPLYEYPLSQKTPGRPRLVAFTKDLQFIRIGSQVFSKGDNQEYKPLPILGSENDYFEEMASNGHLIAVSTRRQISKTDIKVPEQAASGSSAVDYAEIMLRAEEEMVKVLDQLTATVPSSSTQPTTTVTKSSKADDASSVTSATSFTVDDADDFVDESLMEQEKVLDARSESGHTDELLHSSSDDSISSNTAYTSWSEASSELMSDEMEDEDQWNDQPLTLEELELEKREGSLYGDSSEAEENANELLLDADIKSSFSETDESQGRRPELEGMYSDVESHLSSESYSFSDSQEGSEDGAMFEDMMVANKTTKTEGAHRISIRIYSPTRLDRVPIFHYSCYIKGALFDSPPEFHPSKPLLVWPLGDGEILFANYERKTYFTRELCRSHARSCHVSVKTYFSRDGQYVHFAALEACEADKSEEGQPHKVLLSLQVTTHRLSVLKTARSPPRLVFRTTISLGGAPSIQVSNLPYFLTWTDTELFFTIRGRELNMIRIPLFQSPTSSSTETKPNIRYLKSPIFLPRSTYVRNMYFFPEVANGMGKRDKKASTLILGSHCSLPNQDFAVPKSMSFPPIGVFLRENTDLEWACKKTSDETYATQRMNNACGRLKGKFESFDLVEDCDIVPYLF